MPGRGLWSLSLIQTIKVWTPLSSPLIISHATTIGKFAWNPNSPGQNLYEEIVGELRTISSVLGSNVAVVSIPWIFVPCPSSVYA